MKFDSDKCTGIISQNFNEPEHLKTNWLPSPQAGEEFELTFRMYYPKESVLNRSYKMPGVQKVN